jgi:hypothetical protein
MSYMHVLNLYKDPRILKFRECWAMEKIHGTSAHVSFKFEGGLVVQNFFSGGANHAEFLSLFNQAALESAYKASVFFTPPEEGVPARAPTTVIVYGEAYGGKMQKMGDTYGPNLKFIAFEVAINDRFLCVPDAHKIANGLGFEFVHYELTSTDIPALEKLRDAPSVQAVRNGMGTDKLREGIVLRPPFEFTYSHHNNEERCIVKFKGDAFAERVHQPKVSKDSDAIALEKLSAEAFTKEWVTEMRLNHVLDAFVNPSITDTGKIIAAMVEDVTRESEGEAEITPAVRKAVSQATALMFKSRLQALPFDKKGNQ